MSKRATAKRNPGVTYEPARPVAQGTKRKASNGVAAPDSPWLNTRDRQEERKIKRAAVLRGASHLFVEHGFHATSLDDIAELLHVTKPTLYYYVKNKDEILFECVRLGLQKLHSEMDKIGASGGKPIDRLIAGIRSYVEFVTQDFGLCVIRVGEDPLPPEGRKNLRRMKAMIDEEFRNVITEAIADGSLADCDPRMAAFLVGGALSWIGRWYRPDGAYTPAQIADHFASILMNGLIRKTGDSQDGAPMPVNSKRR
jgi:AcrR family transcriptional regulator